MKVLLYVIGTAQVLAGLLGVVLIVVMIQNPGGIGVEQLVVPIVGVVALAFFGAAAACFYLASRIRPGPR